RDARRWLRAVIASRDVTLRPRGGDARDGSRGSPIVVDLGLGDDVLESSRAEAPVYRDAARPNLVVMGDPRLAARTLSAAILFRAFMAAGVLFSIAKHVSWIR